MNLLDRAEILPRKFIRDDRGWFFKMIDGSEQEMAEGRGEVYITMGYPGESRGGHFHNVANEWFTIISGCAKAVVKDPVAGSRKEFHLCIESAVTLFIPAGLAHCFFNLDPSSPFLLVAYTDRLYDPLDTISHAICP